MNINTHYIETIRENPGVIVIICIITSIILFAIFKHVTGKSNRTVTKYNPHNPLKYPLEPPIMGLYNNFVSSAECKEIIEFGQNLVKPSPVGFDNDSDTSVRSSWQAWIDADEYPVIQRLRSRIAKLVGYPETHQEQFQLLRYKSTQQYKHHLDSCNPQAADYQHCKEDARASGGFRELTFLIYLNGNFTGGETDFPAIKKKVKPSEGRAVLFRNLLPGTDESDPDALHAGLPVMSGTKWAINVWIRNGPYLPNL